jgi:hypothetical protein
MPALFHCHPDLITQQEIFADITQNQQRYCCAFDLFGALASEFVDAMAPVLPLAAV